MIKKSVFEEDLVNGMYKIVTAGDKAENLERLSEAIDCLSSASDIFLENGLVKQSNAIMNLLSKIANDPHTHGLTSEKMVDNLKDHGHEMNLSDDANDVLDSDLGMLDGEVIEDTDSSFEDEI